MQQGNKVQVIIIDAALKNFKSHFSPSVECSIVLKIKLLILRTTTDSNKNTTCKFYSHFYVKGFNILDELHVIM